MKQSDLESGKRFYDLRPLLLIRFSEIGIKSAKTRRWLTKKLISHIEYVLKIHKIENFKIENRFSRILIFTENVDHIIPILTNYIPGIASVSKVYETNTTLNEITELISNKFFTNIKKHSTFAVRVKRTGKHSFSSIEIAANIGEYILDRIRNIKVDLSNPEYTIYLEIRDDITYIFTDIQKGLGGLPAGCQGNVLVIISGEEEDVANIMQLYKRGANTILYSICNISQYSKEYKNAITELLSLQGNLKEKNIFEINNLNEKEILDYYTEKSCLSIGMSKKIFTENGKKFPSTIPIFVPFLVTNWDKKEISVFLK